MAGWDEADTAFMAQALALATAAADGSEVPVGAIVVQDGRILGRGHNRTLTDCDPTGHAEVVALREAAQEMGNHRLTEATLYVTLEPCAMCVGAISEARISRVVFGAYDEKAGACGSKFELADTDLVGHHMEVNGGLLEAESAEILRAFFEARRDG
ncbi:MAG: tRNA adenosine(34) deaminase TadA [Woeseiaceae bacterium]|jgi:tRNA(adenine34) deaminase|nr:tRNA adenosine(34) deaminase TadA [Woeseiaceae bacterium]